MNVHDVAFLALEKMNSFSRIMTAKAACGKSTLSDVEKMTKIYSEYLEKRCDEEDDKKLSLDAIKEIILIRMEELQIYKNLLNIT